MVFMIMGQDQQVNPEPPRTLQVLFQNGAGISTEAAAVHNGGEGAVSMTTHCPCPTSSTVKDSAPRYPKADVSSSDAHRRSTPPQAGMRRFSSRALNSTAREEGEIHEDKPDNDGGIPSVDGGKRKPASRVQAVRIYRTGNAATAAAADPSGIKMNQARPPRTGVKRQGDGRQDQEV
jgi:hypothetical protein